MRRIQTVAATLLLTAAIFPQVALAQEPPPPAPEECNCERRFGPERMVLREMMPPRVMLGISMSGDDPSDGVLIQDVTEDSPAQEAGLMSGDLITGLAGHDLTQPLDLEEEEDVHEGWAVLAGSAPQQRLRTVIAGLEADEPVDITWIRDGQTTTGTIIPREMGSSAMTFSFGGGRGMTWSGDLHDLRESDEHGVQFFRFGGPEGAARHRIEIAPDIGRHLRMEVLPEIGDQRIEIRRLMAEAGDQMRHVRELRMVGEGPCRSGSSMIIYDNLGCVDGVQMIPLNEGLGEYFGTAEGVLVTEAADENGLGLQSGDIILRIGDREVRDPGHAARILSSYDEGEEISLTVRRQNRETQITGVRRH